MDPEYHILDLQDTWMSRDEVETQEHQRIGSVMGAFSYHSNNLRDQSNGPSDGEAVSKHQAADAALTPTVKVAQGRESKLHGLSTGQSRSQTNSLSYLSSNLLYRHSNRHYTAASGEQGAFYHVPPDSTRGVTVQCTVPPEIASLGLIPVKRPAKPHITRATLTSLEPCITYVTFGCSDHCRTKGICVHYQFLCGCRRVPDGLICQKCQDADPIVEKALRQRRLCPYHRRPHDDRQLSSRPEDFLANEEQVQRYEEILRRSLEADWREVAVPQIVFQDPFADSDLHRWPTPQLIWPLP